MERKIRRALISVYHKDGLADILALLHREGVEFVSTGGTRAFVESLGYPCVAVEGLTQYPSMLGGRVKTLHPAILGGILARRDNETDMEEVARYGIPLIDLVIVDLYPFSETVASGAGPEEIIEKIDVGGISLIRGAAKNYNDVVIVASKAQYASLYEILSGSGAHTTLEERRSFAQAAFAVSSAYDSAISEYFQRRQAPTALRIAIDGAQGLRYGENPHQAGTFYGNLSDLLEQLHGKEISYNNLQDIDAAIQLIQDFDEPTFAILKHNNACGIASRANILEAWQAALACDPISAFGGVLIANRVIDLPTAQEINKLFCEVLIAPGYAPEALEVLCEKKNRILLLQRKRLQESRSFRSMLGGVLAQESDLKTESASEMRIVTEQSASDAELEDLVFACKVVKHSKSNAIVLAKDKRLLASGIGQTSRIDALRQAIEKARSFGFELEGAVMASDAFFPFGDCVTMAAEAGITAIVQPGGSVRDGESIEAANKYGVAMAMTGVRHFKH